METRKQTQPRTRRKRKATTQDVVGDVQAPIRIPSKWQKHYDHLMRLRDHFLRRQVNSAKDAIEEAPSYSLHMADAGTDTYDRDLALGMLSSEQDAVYQIEQALNRIQNGTYGTCELTGKPIEPERLEAIPWTRFSADAEKKLEREGVVRRARLGPRETVARESTTKAPEDAG
ncbi:MAG TPA: TraR/DksA C4-type zinc finger protein [Clostridia bacterium]|nr:TraR/DksA C4-type zinc finger protein [Clostridia bacterium]